MKKRHGCCTFFEATAVDFLCSFRDSTLTGSNYWKFADGNTPLYLLYSREEWTKEIFPSLKWIADHLSEKASETPASHTRKIFDMIAYLHEHYTEKISLTELSQSVFMSRNECCRYFKQMMSMTITEYLLEYRLSKAAELLETSDMSITEASKIC